jgi:putative ABC transport system permease protein
MWRSHTITAFRSLLRSRFYTSLNLVGLAVGMAAVLLIALYVQHELTWDRHLPEHEQVFRLVRKSFDPARDDTPATPWVTIQIAREYLPQVPGIAATALVGRGRTQVHHRDEILRQELIYAEPSFIQVFEPIVLDGDPATFLDDPDELVLTRSTAEKYFGEVLVAGETLVINDNNVRREVRVAGVLEDPPPNSTVHYDMILPFQLQYDRVAANVGNMWGVVFSRTWLRLEAGTDPADVETALHSLPVKSAEDYSEIRKPQRYDLQPATSVHLDLDNSRNQQISGDPQALRILIAIGIAVMLLACINYSILTVGRSTSRQREIGVRKVLGARKSELARQFWLETGLLVSLALLPALLLVELFLPFFNDYAETSLSLNANPSMMAIALGAVIISTLLAGLYPSLVMTGFPVITSLKGSLRLGGRGGFRRALLLLQLTTTILLGSVTAVMLLQLNYVLDRDLGYESDNLLTLYSTTQSGLAEDIAGRLMSDSKIAPGVEHLTAAACNFGPPWNQVGWDREDGTDLEIYQNTVTPSYLSTVGIPLVAGRDFRADEQRGVIIVNETFVRQMELDNPIGATLPHMFGDAQIIGVTADFHYNSLHDPIEPVVLLLTEEDLHEHSSMIISQYDASLGYVILRLTPGLEQATLEALRDAWRGWMPDAAFRADFVDESLATQYQEERRWNKIVGITTGLSVLLALLGLTGTAVLQVLQRSKEIGIRKTLGASVATILGLLCRETMALIVVAAVVATPVAWMITQRWLQGFAFHIEDGLTPMLLASSAVFLLAVSLVLGLSYRLSQVRPADVLRDE